MSGEVVISLAFPLAVVGIAFFGVGAGAIGVANVVKNIVDGRVEIARREMEIEKTRIKEWQKYQEDKKQQMLSFQKRQLSIAESEQYLASVRLTQSKVDRTDILGGLPTEFVESLDSPYTRLIKQEKRLIQKLDAGERLNIEEIESFRETTQRTLRSYMSSLESVPQSVGP